MQTDLMKLTVAFLQFLQMPLKMCTNALYIFSTACHMSPIYLQKYRRTKVMSMDSNHKYVTVIKESQKELILNLMCVCPCIVAYA